MARDDCQLSFICSKSQKDTYKAAAKKAKLSMAMWIRVTLNIQAIRQLQRE